MFTAEAWRLRVAGMGAIVGIDSDPARRKLLRAGLNEDVAEDLLAACERGMVEALNEREDTDVGQG